MFSIIEVLIINETYFTLPDLHFDNTRLVSDVRDENI